MQVIGGGNDRGGRGESGCAVAGFGLTASLVLEATSDTSREE